jgi:hypothetical protein
MKSTIVVMGMLCLIAGEHFDNIKMNNMKTWNFKVKSNPQEIIGKLNSTLGPDHGFVFKIVNSKDDFVKFKIRKRIAFLHQIMQQNRIVVNGKIFKTDTANETNVDFYFTNHFMITYAIAEHLLFFIGGLILIIYGLSIDAFIYALFGGALLAIYIVLLIALQKKFKKYIQEYKTLISEILAK